MSKLLALFIAGFIGLALCYIVLGKFELNQLFLLLLFPIASVLILFVMKWQYNKDLHFKPELKDRFMVTRLGDRVSTTAKQMFNNEEHIGSYNRFYNKWWKRIIADVMDSPGLWY
ncbi:hypothetical protein [Virgibacillus sp. DJP39]|uniref:hypothetical protein n=1 Tax=Virgibacillus sp. DJP39 TaxID=3409790 RepID=UPI003BB4A33D